MNKISHLVTMGPAAVAVTVTVVETVLQSVSKDKKIFNDTDFCVVAVTDDVCAGRVYRLVTVVVVFVVTVVVLGSFK